MRKKKVGRPTVPKSKQRIPIKIYVPADVVKAQGGAQVLRERFKKTIEQ